MDMPEASESSVQHGNPRYLHDAPPQEDVASSSSNQLLLRLAKMPSGDDPISAAFLSTVLGCCDGEGDGQRITGFCVDQGSVIEGRHSTTFRLLLHREDGKGGVGSTITSVTDSSSNGATSTAAVDVTESVTSPTASTSIDTRSSTTIRSVFVKRMTCKELPARSLSKWRYSGRTNTWAT